ncbi:putative disulfide bond formation protein D [Collibacillus ludicampi]|uniref:Disulfide bond formation protein D n=1 Tax=Collibacillus ludicampi TaxID=2771369 RepID=A0AAV4LBM1_9BACL|nr:thioredoxin domain-containing protein [Collibacillus ludicampi]GIM45135.1 putative disulfide bond formation protein D [Collibacillus ludicampi]
MVKTNMAKKIKKHQRQMELETTRKTQRLIEWTLAVIFVVSVALIIMHAISRPQDDQTVDVKEFQYDKHPSIGSKDAPVKIVEFADFKCPACKEFDQTILPQLKKDFIDNGTVQFYYINDPIISPNADSRTAAMAGEAVYRQNPEEFWKFYEAVFAHQGDEHTNWATSDFLVQIAKQSNLKVDYDKLKKDIDNNTFAQDVKNDEDIAEKLGVNSTPTIYINGKEVSDNDTFTYSAIKEAILKAKGETGQ